MSSGPSLKLNYTPQPQTPVRALGAGYLISRLISSYIGYMLVMGVLGLIVPKFQSLFNDIGFRPSAATAFLLTSSALCLRYYLWVAMLPLPAFWALVNVHIADKYRRRRMRLMAFLFVAGFLIFTLFALLVPTMSVRTPAAALP